MADHRTAGVGVVVPGFRGTLIRALLALGISLWLFAPFSHWVYEWRMMPYIVPHLLQPQTGFPSVLLVVLLMLTVPGWLQGRRAVPGAEQARPAHEGRTEGVARGQHARPSEDAIRIPTSALVALGAEHRWEMAEALGITWRDEFIHDHRSWDEACREAVKDAAERLRR